MKLARFNDDRLGLVEGDRVRDVTAALAALPAQRWPLLPGDPLIRHLDDLAEPIRRAAAGAEPVALVAVTLKSPVANPSKIMAAPVNYAKHLAEARADRGIHHGAEVKTIDDYGIFLKSATSLAGPGEGVILTRPERRIDHEVELAVVIGREGYGIAPDQALDHVAGYAIGLDMSIRGPEDRSYRKSFDSFTVLGPWLTTADEVADPAGLDFWLKVNGETRQSSNTGRMIWGIAKLIAYASAAYRLYPGDILLSGTPEGVGPVRPGDGMECWIDQVGHMTVAVR